MSSMNSVALSADNTTALVEPGAKWIQVYETLDPLGYAIPGGRAGDVGVGGLTSGGSLKLSKCLYMALRLLTSIRRQFFFCRSLWVGL